MPDREEDTSNSRFCSCRFQNSQMQIPNSAAAAAAEQQQLLLTSFLAARGVTNEEDDHHGNQSLLRALVVNFVKFCQSTSLRGVPKIVRTQEPLLRTIWASFVFIFFVGCFTCLTLLINQYLAYDVIHQPRTIRNFSVQFPSFTVCNTRPLSQSGVSQIHSLGLLMPKEFSLLVFNSSRNAASMIRRGGGVAFNQTVKDALSTVFDTKGFYESLPHGVSPQEFGHQLSQLVLLCETTILIRDFRRSMFCDAVGHWTRTYDNKFLNCYSFTANPKFTKRMLTVRIMAFTNERESVTCPDCSSFPATQVSGLRVQLHNAGDFPEVQEEGLNIQPGSLTEIRFDTKEWLMLQPPHGKCSTALPPQLSFGGNRFSYSYQACKKKVLQEQILSECKCLDSTIPLPDNLSKLGRSYCGKIPQLSPLRNASLQSHLPISTIARHFNISESSVKLPAFVTNVEFENFIRRIACNMHVFKTAGRVTDSRCLSPCKFYTYGTTISRTSWPATSYLFELPGELKRAQMRMRSMHRRGKLQSNASHLDSILQKLDQIYGDVINISKSQPELAIERMKNIDFVQKNFVEILINRGKSNFDIERIEEKAVVSLTSLLSQIGGLLSIWVGLTFVCIVEVVEMLYNTAVTYTRTRAM